MIAVFVGVTPMGHVHLLLFRNAMLITIDDASSISSFKALLQ